MANSYSYSMKYYGSFFESSYLTCATVEAYPMFEKLFIENYKCEYSSLTVVVVDILLLKFYNYLL